jgi:hypothetical protein
VVPVVPVVSEFPVVPVVVLGVVVVPVVPLVPEFPVVLRAVVVSLGAAERGDVVVPVLPEGAGEVVVLLGTTIFTSESVEPDGLAGTSRVLSIIVVCGLGLATGEGDASGTGTYTGVTTSLGRLVYQSKPPIAATRAGRSRPSKTPLFTFALSRSVRSSP